MTTGLNNMQGHWSSRIKYMWVNDLGEQKHAQMNTRGGGEANKELEWGFCHFRNPEEKITWSPFQVDTCCCGYFCGKARSALAPWSGRGGGRGSSPLIESQKQVDAKCAFLWQIRWGCGTGNGCAGFKPPTAFLPTLAPPAWATARYDRVPFLKNRLAINEHPTSPKTAPIGLWERTPCKRGAPRPVVVLN